MTEVLAETQPPGILAPCAGCGHACYVHKPFSLSGATHTCLAAIPVKRNGDGPGFGEYTAGKGSAHDFGTSTCPCRSCRCVNCAPAAAPEPEEAADAA